MTAQLSREQVEWLRDAATEFTSTNMKMTMKPEEVLQLTTALLAGMDNEPVAYADPQAFRNFKAGAARREWMWRNPGEDLIPVFTAPPAPVALVADAWKLSDAEKFIEKYNPPSIEEAALFAWNACRAAMQAEHVTAATVPDGWKLVPIIAFPSQWAAGQKAFNAAGINKVDAVYKAMVAAAPAAPEQEV